jgi:hypothetical protein
VLYVPKAPVNFNFPREWEDGITFPKGTHHTIKISGIGDKP